MVLGRGLRFLATICLITSATAAASLASLGPSCHCLNLGNNDVRIFGSSQDLVHVATPIGGSVRRWEPIRVRAEVTISLHSGLCDHGFHRLLVTHGMIVIREHKIPKIPGGGAHSILKGLHV